MGITPVFESVLALGLCQFGLVTEDGFRKFVEPVEQGFQLAVLLGCCFVEWSRLRRQLYVHRFAVGLVGELVIGTVPLGGIGGAGTLGLSTLHHPLQNRTFAEKADLLEAAPEREKSLRVPFQGGMPLGRANSTLGNRNT